MSAVSLVLGQHDGPAVPTGSYSNHTLSGSGLAVAWVRCVETTSAITAVKVRYGARTGTPPTYLVRIEGLDASGNPNGVDKGGASPTAVTFTPPASTAWNGLIQTFTFTNSYTPSGADEKVAFVVRYSSGTVDGANCSSFTNVVSGQDATTRGIPYTATYNGTSWTKPSGSGAIGWVAGGAVRGTPIQSTYSTATANTNGHRSAAYFTIPAAVGTTYDIAGVDIAGKAAAAGATCFLKLWDSSWNVLRSVTIDGDCTINPGNQNVAHRQFFSSAYRASTGTKYYIGFECDGSATVGTTGITVSDVAEMAAYPNGENVGIVTWNGTTTTETNTVYPCFNLILSDITVPSGGSVAYQPVRRFM